MAGAGSGGPADPLPLNLCHCSFRSLFVSYGLAHSVSCSSHSDLLEGRGKRQAWRLLSLPLCQVLAVERRLPFRGG